jgi:hypothetical protein
MASDGSIGKLPQFGNNIHLSAIKMEALKVLPFLINLIITVIQWMIVIANYNPVRALSIIMPVE